jgi:O-acetyl-ADP-ribose deacetylase (regulator of RNase III)
MTVVFRKGDMFEGNLPALAHGCNIVGVMGAGVAAQMRQRWPSMYGVYHSMCVADNFRLGEVFMWEALDDGVTIFNLATQPMPGPTASKTAIAISLTRMVELARYLNIAEIGMPWIGCGIGGLRKSDLEEILSYFESDRSITLVVVEYAPPVPDPDDLAHDLAMRSRTRPFGERM